jgi:carboxyl-terminal processing protease
MTTARQDFSQIRLIQRVTMLTGLLATVLFAAGTGASAQESHQTGYRSAYRPVARQNDEGYFGDADYRADRRYRDIDRFDRRGDDRRGNDWGRDDAGYSRDNSWRDDSNGYSERRRVIRRPNGLDDIFSTGRRSDPFGVPRQYSPEPEQRGAPYVHWTPQPSRFDDRPIEQPLPGVQELISRRYQDPTVLRFIAGLSPDRAAAAYAEVLNLIAARHITPPNPGQLAQRGISNIVEALRNPTFVQANRFSGDSRQAAWFQQTMDAQLRQRPMQRAEDAVAVMQVAMQVGQQIGLSPGIVATEFIYGAIESLDRFSAFMPPEAARTMNQQLGANVVGIGVQIEAKEQAIRVVKVLPGGSAQQSGMQQGDVITSVDGRPVYGDLETATSLITGREGTMVTLALVRNGRGMSPISLVRRNVTVYSVTDVQMVDASAGVGYLKLDTFAANSAKEMEQALWSLHQQGMRSLVLDLRGNPGGLLTTAVEVSNLFLPSGTIVSTRGRTQNDNSIETATQSQTWKVPLIVLVDENSASASEIFAAAIQENGRGLIVGRRTYGKGSVQTLFPLQSISAGLRLTTAKFYSPNGRDMAGAGVQPDVPVRTGGGSLFGGGIAADSDVAAAVDAARRGVTNGNYLSRR